MKQKEFTFKYYHHDIFRLGSQPPDAFEWKDYIKKKMLKKGYLVHNLKEEHVIMVSCNIAKANVSFKERVRMQEMADATSKQTSFTISTPPPSSQVLHN